MRIAILGAGPAGLYLAYLLKRSRPNWSIALYEQNAAQVTFGFGLAFSQTALDFLAREDPETLAAIAPALQRWRDSVLDLNGQTVRIDGMDYAGIGRLALLKILTARAHSVGIDPVYNQRIESLDEVSDADLIVGADGANSLVRRTHADAFGATEIPLHNRFAWYGTRKHFSALGHSFVERQSGFFNAHHHPHAPDMSTVVVEMDEATFLKDGFDAMPQAEAQSLMAEIFAATLDGQPLISNNSIWRRFPKIRCERWSVENCVLLGDALHTVHFSIGSGTRLALEDAIALAKALLDAGGIPAALAGYEASRKPKVSRYLDAADQSADWYEHFPEKMRLPPLDFAMSYITRSGRVDLDRLKQTSPDFVAQYEAHRSTARQTP